MTPPPLRAVQAFALAAGASRGRAPGYALRLAACARDLGRRLGLGSAQQEAVELAALLGETAGLARPALNGANRPEIGERSRAHLVVALGMAQHMGLPRETAEIVKALHERWDGQGWPRGLRGDSIPLGARILAVAACVAGRNAATALEELRANSGTAFDPALVAALCERLPETAAGPALPFEYALRAAWQEEVALQGIIAELGSSLSLHESLAALDNGLRPLLGYASLVFYAGEKDILAPAYVCGRCPPELRSIEVPLGKGLVGGAASSLQAVAADEAGCSVLALPLACGGEPVGVLALHHSPEKQFSPDDLRVVLKLQEKLAAALHNARRYEHAEQCSVVDPATGLPNGRALFLRLDAELARCRRTNGRLAVVVCELRHLGVADANAAETRRAYVAIANGLRRLLREDDCVARQGDNFVLVLSGFAPAHLARKQEQIDALVHDACSSLSANLAAAFYPEDGAYAEDLLAAADRRLNQQVEPRSGARNTTQ